MITIEKGKNYGEIVDAAEAATIDLYNKIEKNYTGFSDGFWNESLELFQKTLGKGRVIEIGCGNGRDAKLFLEHEFGYVGFDASSEMLRVAQENVPKGSFYLADARDLSFLEEDQFDGFWSVATLFHVQKISMWHVLYELRKTTKPGGIGFISLQVIHTSDENDEEILTEKFFGEEECSRFLSYYTKEEFKGMLDEVGFETLSISVKEEDSSTKKDWLCCLIRNTKTN